MKKVLIAIDYNPVSEKVAELGYAIAKSMHAEVMLIHVFTEPEYYALDFSPVMGYQGGYSTGTAILVDDIKIEAQDFLAASVRHIGDKNIKTTLLEGDATESIIKFSKEWEADLIVMGSHSHKGLQSLLVTDVASYVMKHSKIPLLTIPTGDK